MCARGKEKGAIDVKSIRNYSKSEESELVDDFGKFSFTVLAFSLVLSTVHLHTFATVLHRFFPRCMSNVWLDLLSYLKYLPSNKNRQSGCLIASHELEIDSSIFEEDIAKTIIRSKFNRIYLYYSIAKQSAHNVNFIREMGHKLPSFVEIISLELPSESNGFFFSAQSINRIIYHRKRPILRAYRSQTHYKTIHKITSCITAVIYND